MRKLMILALLLNVLLLAGRFWQELPVNAQTNNEPQPALDERFCADSNGDGQVNIVLPQLEMESPFVRLATPTGGTHGEEKTILGRGEGGDSEGASG